MIRFSLDPEVAEGHALSHDESFPERVRCVRCGHEIAVDSDDLALWTITYGGSGAICDGCVTTRDKLEVAADIQAIADMATVEQARTVEQRVEVLQQQIDQLSRATLVALRGLVQQQTETISNLTEQLQATKERLAETQDALMREYRRRGSTGA